MGKIKEKCRTIITNYVPLLLLFVIINGCESSSGDGTDSNDQVVELQTLSVSITEDLSSFIGKAQSWETTNLESLTVNEVKALVDEYIYAGEQFVNTANAVIALQGRTMNSKLEKVGVKSGSPCGPVDLIPGLDNGLSPGLVKTVGDLIAETRGEVDAIQKKWENKEIDDNTYYEAMNKVRKQKTLKSVNVGLGAVLGTGASLAAGAVVGATTAPAVVVIGAVAATGVAVGTTVTWFCNWYSGVKSSNNASFLTCGKTKIGDAIPSALLAKGANLVVVIDGYAPVCINNLEMPKAGDAMTIEIEPKKVKNVTNASTTQVCIAHNVMQGDGCSDVQYVVAKPSPANPAPGQSVLVTATLLPKVVGCRIHFSIVGTDGYTNKASYASDSNGEATFSIPGGDANVFDKVTITSDNGKQYIVTYTF